jgi:hypothetical protein
MSDRSSWGNNPVGANDAPAWNYLANEMRGSQSNVVASNSGWQVVHPWGNETIVAIGELANTSVYAPFGVTRYSTLLTAPGHTATEHLKVMLQLNRGAVSLDANTANVYIVAIGNDANTANVNLLYKPLLSDPGAGELVFEATAVDLSLNAGDTLTINSTSTLHGAGFKSLYGTYALALTGSLVLTIA